MEMRRVVDLLFEALMLNRIPRSGYSFLGAGKESDMEHGGACSSVALVRALSGLRSNIRSPSRVG